MVPLYVKPGLRVANGRVVAILEKVGALGIDRSPNPEKHHFAHVQNMAPPVLPAMLE